MWLAFCKIGRANKAQTEAHRRQAFQMRLLRKIVCPLRSPCLAPEATHETRKTDQQLQIEQTWGCKAAGCRQEGRREEQRGRNACAHSYPNRCHDAGSPTGPAPASTPAPAPQPAPKPAGRLRATNAQPLQPYIPSRSAA